MRNNNVFSEFTNLIQRSNFNHRTKTRISRTFPCPVSNQIPSGPKCLPCFRPFSSEVSIAEWNFDWSLIFQCISYSGNQLGQLSLRPGCLQLGMRHQQEPQHLRGLLDHPRHFCRCGQCRTLPCLLQQNHHDLLQRLCCPSDPSDAATVARPSACHG